MSMLRKFWLRVARAGGPYVAALWQDALLVAAVVTLLAVFISLEACAPGGRAAPPGAPAAATAPAKSGHGERVIHIILKKSGYSPDQITVRQGEAVVLELEAVDHDHGFKLAAFGINQDVDQGQTVRIRLVPGKAGSFEFHCDVYCGDFHDDMTGTLIVTAA